MKRNSIFVSWKDCKLTGHSFFVWLPAITFNFRLTCCSTFNIGVHKNGGSKEMICNKFDSIIFKFSCAKTNNKKSFFYQPFHGSWLVSWLSWTLVSHQSLWKKLGLKILWRNKHERCKKMETLYTQIRFLKNLLRIRLNILCVITWIEISFYVIFSSVPLKILFLNFLSLSVTFHC